MNTPIENTSSPRRYAAVYAEMWKNSVSREMGFKTNFLMWIVVEFLWFALQISFFMVIYSHTKSIGSWTQWQVVMLVGASHFIQQVFTACFLNNCVQLSENIRTGKLDFMLLLPLNTRFLVSTRHVDLGCYFNAATAVLVMLYAGRRLALSPSSAELIGFALLMAAGVLVHYSMMFMLATISFWTVRAQGIVYSYYSLFNIARYPDEAFRGLFKVCFTYALPMLLVVNVPARLITRKLASYSDMLLLLGVALLFFFLSEWFWRVSLKRYTSASS